MYSVIRNIIVVPVLLFLMTGCGGGHSGGQVAVVDLDKMAAAIGRDKLIEQRVLSFSKQQETALIKLRDDSRAQIEKQKKQLAASPGEEAKNKIDALTQNLENGLRQEIVKAKQKTDQVRTKLVVEFRTEVEPITRRIAAQRGMDIVMVKQNTMLYVGPLADITDAVIDDMQQNSKKQSATSESPDKAEKSDKSDK